MPIPRTSGEVSITLPARTFLRVAQAAIESQDQAAVVAGLTLANELDGSEDCEDLSPIDHAERHLDEVPVLLGEALAALDQLRDAVYHVDGLRMEHLITPTLNNRGDVMELVSHASLLLRSARAQAVEVSR